ncbi:unnamed protein product, partial [Linum tenue]
MARSSSALCFLLAILLFTSQGEEKMGVEAEDCEKQWDCDHGPKRCKQDCADKYQGKGECEP